MLAVEYDETGGTVIMAGNATALRALAKRLETLAAKAEGGQLDHDHLYSELWAGYDLASTLPDSASGGTIVHHVKIYGLPA